MEKPKFCPQCGKPLESSSSARCEEDESFDEPAVEKIGANIKELDIEFDIESLTVKKETFESLMGTLDKVSEHQSSEKFPAPSKKEVLEQYRKEAGTLRDNRLSEENEQT